MCECNGVGARCKARGWGAWRGLLALSLRREHWLGRCRPKNGFVAPHRRQGAAFIRACVLSPRLGQGQSRPGQVPIGVGMGRGGGRDRPRREDKGVYFSPARSGRRHAALRDTGRPYGPTCPPFLSLSLTSADLDFFLNRFFILVDVSEGAMTEGGEDSRSVLKPYFFFSFFTPGEKKKNARSLPPRRPHPPPPPPRLLGAGHRGGSILAPARPGGAAPVQVRDRRRVSCARLFFFNLDPHNPHSRHRAAVRLASQRGKTWDDGGRDGAPLGRRVSVREKREREESGVRFFALPRLQAQPHLFFFFLLLRPGPSRRAGSCISMS